MKQSWIIVLALGFVVGCGKTDTPPAAATPADRSEEAKEPLSPEMAWYAPHYEDAAKWDAVMAMNYNLSRKKQKLIGIDKLPEVLEVEGTIASTSEYTTAGATGPTYPVINVFLKLNDQNEQAQCTLFFKDQVDRVKALPQDAVVRIRGTHQSHSGDKVGGLELTRCELVEVK